jgi:hypothetical protein
LRAFHFSPRILPTSPVRIVSHLHEIGMKSNARLTELDAGVVLADLLAGLVGEEHVGGQTTLGGVGVWRSS